MKNTKYIFSFLFCLLFLKTGVAQTNSKIDKYLKEYDTATIDTKIQLFHFFFNQFEGDEKDSVMYYVNDLRRLGILKKRNDAIAMANFGMAPYLQDNALYNEARSRLKKALEYYQSVENDTMLSTVFNALGNTDYLSGNQTRAEIYYKKSAKVAKGQQAKKYKMQALYNLSMLYINQSKNEQAKQILTDYINFLNIDKFNKKLASAYGLMGQIYSNEKQNEKAIGYYNKSINFGLASGKYSAVANSYTNMGIAEFLSNNYERSEQYFRLALRYRMKENVSNKISASYYNLGDFYMGVNKMDSALVNYQLAEEYAIKSKNPQSEKDALMQINAVYEKEKNKDKQIANYKQIIALQDKIGKEESDNKIAALKSNFNQSNHELEDRGQMREEKLFGELSRYKMIFNIWVVVVLVALTGLVILYTILRKRKEHQEAEG